jgi:hypothetical protein
MVDGIIDIVRKVKDIKNRKAIVMDMIEKFKKENIKTDYNKFMKDCGVYVNKKKKETQEATSSGAAGQYSAPLFTQSQPEKSQQASKIPTVESVMIGGETAEATSSSSTGQYSTPGWIAPNAKKWRGAAKTQIPGGKFVQIKKKCQKFPYCNQGDIKALKLYENQLVKQSIESVSNKLGLDENVIKSIIQHELEEMMIKRKK